jgi:aminoglycoside phosphotransferase (APT) family kinase protein
VWSVLGAECRTVAAFGDPDLPVILREAGLTVTDGPADAVVADLEDGRVPGELVEAARGADVLAVAVRGGSRALDQDRSRPERALELLGAPATALRARRDAERVARALGGALERVPTGDRSRSPALGARALRAERGLARGWLLVRRPAGRASVLDEAVAGAEAAAAGPLERTTTRVLPSGKLLVLLRGAGGDRYVLRLAAGPARAFLDRSAAALERLAASAVGDRVIAPLATGEAGVARWVADPWAPGAHPRALDPELRDACVDFLVALHEAPAEDADPLARLERHAEALAAAAPAQAGALPGLLEVVRTRLAGLPAGWQHGDFWNENLMAADGRLAAVLDWDWVAGDALPLLDVFDLAALGPRKTRFLTPGPRVLDVLLPLARAGGDDLVRAYARRRGIPADPATLEALAVAYWMDRAGRELRPFDERRDIPAWVAANVERPLAVLGREVSDSAWPTTPSSSATTP